MKIKDQEACSKPESASKPNKKFDKKTDALVALMSKTSFKDAPAHNPLLKVKFRRYVKFNPFLEKIPE